MTAEILKLRNEFRDLFKGGVTPTLAVRLNQRFKEALEKDPEHGTQIRNLIDELKELSQPMKN